MFGQPWSHCLEKSWNSLNKIYFESLRYKLEWNTVFTQVAFCRLACVLALIACCFYLSLQRVIVLFQINDVKESRLACLQGVFAFIPEKELTPHYQLGLTFVPERKRLSSHSGLKAEDRGCFLYLLTAWEHRKQL